MSANPHRAFDVIRATTTEMLQQRINLARSILGHRCEADGSLGAADVRELQRVLEGEAAA